MRQKHKNSYLFDDIFVKKILIYFGRNSYNILMIIKNLKF